MSKDSSVNIHNDSQLSTRYKSVQIVAWAICGLSVLIAIIAWGKLTNWHLSLSAYSLFPLFGLLAFSIMWSHYVAGFVRTNLGVKPVALSRYFSSTSLLVLALLILHPAVLIVQRYRDGFGFPPGSYKSYVAPGLGWVTLLGSVSWVAFMLFELGRWFRDKSWFVYIARAGDIAMLAIVYHGLRIGDHLQMGWYRGLWIGYGVVLILILASNYYDTYNAHTRKNPA